MSDIATYLEYYVPPPLTIAVSFGDEQLDEMANHAIMEETAQAFIDELKRRQAQGEIMNAVAMEALSFTGDGYRIADMFFFLKMLDEDSAGSATAYASLAEQIAQYVQTTDRAGYAPFVDDNNYSSARKWLADKLDSTCKEKQIDVSEQIDYVVNYPRDKNLSRADVMYQLRWELHNE